jgi:predicted esterase YcpF (UPF0227 family)
MQSSFKTIIYLHGFQSSSRSQKATIISDYLKTKQFAEGFEIGFVSPNLPFSPSLTLQKLNALLDKQKRPVLIGSSMGGFYAAYLSQKRKLPAVLINPVVAPELLFDDLFNQEIENEYTGERHRFVQADLDLFKQMTLRELAFPKLIFNLLETGDEVLDYRLAEKKYKICNQKVFQGGDHRFQNFENCLPDILKFYEQA